MWYALKGTGRKPDGEEISKIFGVTQDRAIIEQHAEGLKLMTGTTVEIVEVSDEEGERYSLLP